MQHIYELEHPQNGEPGLRSLNFSSDGDSTQTVPDKGDAAFALAVCLTTTGEHRSGTHGLHYRCPEPQATSPLQAAQITAAENPAEALPQLPTQLGICFICGERSDYVCDCSSTPAEAENADEHTSGTAPCEPAPEPAGPAIEEPPAGQQPQPRHNSPIPTATTNRHTAWIGREWNLTPPTSPELCCSTSWTSNDGAAHRATVWPGSRVILRGEVAIAASTGQVVEVFGLVGTLGSFDGHIARWQVVLDNGTRVDTTDRNILPLEAVKPQTMQEHDSPAYRWLNEGNETESQPTEDRHTG